MSKDDSERMADELRAEALKRIADIRSDARPPPLVFPCNGPISRHSL